MYPWRLIAMLEKADPSFQKLFYPKRLHCPLQKRTERAIEEHWVVYFPTHKECRGLNWTLKKPEPFYTPRPQSRQKLEQWKEAISGTIVEIRAYGADISWNRFAVICRNIPKLKSLLKDFKPLADFLATEESLWPRYGGVAVSQDDFLQGQMRALLGPGSPYHHSDPQRLRFLRSKKPVMMKNRAIDSMRQLLDRPLMVLATIQKCARNAEHWRFWLPIQKHVAAVIEMPAPGTFRQTWLKHVMLVSGAIKKNGEPCPRKWARMLVAGKPPELDAINTKAVEVNSWLKGRKKLSLKNVMRSGRIVFNTDKQTLQQAEAGNDLWLFSWMLTLWLERHFTEVAAEFKGDNHKIRRYYRRFFHYLKTDRLPHVKQGAGGVFSRQP